jgi:inner membrane transporter RhtA
MPAPDAHPVDRGARNRVLVGVAMILGTSASIQVAAALASTQFDRLGPAGASSVRFAFGAVVLLLLVRPSWRRRSAATWTAIVAYGVSLAVLNLSYFAAIDRIPLGIAVSLAFVGPLAMAFATSHRRRDVGFALLAAAGVATLGGIDRPGSILGIVLALVAGFAWTGVAYAGRSLGRQTRGVDGLALALPVAALLTLPFGLVRLGRLDAPAAATMLVVAVGGLILPFALELEGLRRLEPGTVAVVYSVDPAIAAAVGFLALGQRLTAPQLLGLAAVVAASVGATRSAARRGREFHPESSEPARGGVEPTI